MTENNILDKIVGKRAVIFTNKNFRFQGEVKAVNDQFIEIFDELKQKSKMISIKEITELEFDEDEGKLHKTSFYQQ